MVVWIWRVVGRFGHEFQRGGIDTIAEARGFWAVGEDVAQVRVAAAAKRFGSHHPKGSIFFFGDDAVFDWLPITWPSRAGFKFMFGREQGQTTPDADIGSRLFIVPVFARKRLLGAFLTGDAIRGLVEALAPFFVGKGLPVEFGFGVGVGLLWGIGFGHGLGCVGLDWRVCRWRDGGVGPRRNGRRLSGLSFRLGFRLASGRERKNRGSNE